MEGINRTEIDLILDEEDGKYIIPSELQTIQNRSNVPLFVACGNKLWFSNTNHNIETQPIHKVITQNDISSGLIDIILHNDKTGQKDNDTRLDYILKATNALLTHQRGVVSMPTGSGKSLVIAMLAEQLKDKKLLIIAPSLVIVSQLKSLLKKIGIINIDIFTHLTASKIEPDVIGGVPKYDCIIFDEVHKMSCNSYLKSLFRSETKQIYGLSASISKYGTCSAKFHIGKLVYELPYDIARTFKSSINGIKYFHKFEFGNSKSENMELLENQLLDLQIQMQREIWSVNGIGWAREMRIREIRARYVNMGFLIAEKSEERNSFISQILQAISKKGLLNITFLRTKECGRLLIKMMPQKSTLFWCAEGMYIYEGGECLKKVDYEYIDTNFGKELNNILATSCLQMGVNLQFTHGTINSILLLSGSTHNSLAQQVGRAVRCNPSPLPARAHTIIDLLPLLETNANNRVKDLSDYFSLSTESEILHKQENWQFEYENTTR